MKYKGLIMDMDGTLFDTEVLSREAWYAIGKHFNLPMNDAFIFSLIGKTKEDNRSTFDTQMPKHCTYDEAKAFHKQYTDAYVLKHGAPIKEGVVELLEYCKQHQITMVLATSAIKETAYRNLNSANILDYFQYIVTGDDVIKGKPDPEIFLTAQQRLGLKKEECLILEDSPNGILAAYRSGIDVCLIPDILEPTEAMLTQSTYHVSCIKDVIALLEE